MRQLSPVLPTHVGIYVYDKNQALFFTRRKALKFHTSSSKLERSAELMFTVPCACSGCRPDRLSPIKQMRLLIAFLAFQFLP
jgi:hypothetical protein